MIMRTLLIPIDQEEVAQDLVLYAEAIARHLDFTTIHLLNVVPINPPSDIAATLAQSALPIPTPSIMAENAQLMLGKFAHQLRELGVHVVTQVLYEWNVAEAISQYAKNINANLVVMSTHGRKGLSRLFLGSVAEEVVQKAPCAVLTARIDAKLTEPPFIRKILVPTDFSEHAKTALQTAKRLAEVFRAELTLLHVVTESGLEDFYDAYWRLTTKKETVRNRVHRFLGRSYVEAGGAEGLTYHCAVRFGNPVTEVTQFVARQNIDLVVLPTHGRTGLAHVVMGSVTEKLARTAACPVLTLKSFGNLPL